MSAVALVLSEPVSSHMCLTMKEPAFPAVADRKAGLAEGEVKTGTDLSTPVAPSTASVAAASAASAASVATAVAL